MMSTGLKDLKKRFKYFRGIRSELLGSLLNGLTAHTRANIYAIKRLKQIDVFLETHPPINASVHRPAMVSIEAIVSIQGASAGRVQYRPWPPGGAVRALLGREEAPLSPPHRVRGRDVFPGACADHSAVHRRGIMTIYIQQFPCIKFCCRRS